MPAENMLVGLLRHKCLKDARRPSRLGPSRVGQLSLAAVLIAALLVSSAGCAKAIPTPDPVEISFAFPNVDTEMYQQQLEQFNERYPYITVNLRSRRWDRLGGTNPGDADVFINSQFAMGWLQGELLDLSPFIEEDQSFNTSDFYPGTLDLYVREGKTWAIPSGVDIMVMYYNQDLFDQYEVAYPRAGWTWDDFLTTALALRDTEAKNFGYAPSLDLFDALTFIYQHGGQIFDNLQNPTRTTFDDLLTIDALNWYAKLIYDYNVAPTPEQMQEAFGQSEAASGIYQGKVGMWTGMLSGRGGQNPSNRWPMRWGMVPLPRDAQATTLTLVEGYFVSSRTQYPDACWKWISFLSKQMPARNAPARRSLAESTEYSRQAGSDVASVVRASMESALMLSPELAEFEEALNVFGQALQTIMSQSATPEKAMTWAQQQSEPE